MRVKSLCLTDSIKDCIFFSVSEDSIARVWNYDCLQQVIKHPNSLWDVDIQYDDGNIRMMTACSDGVLVFSMF